MHSHAERGNECTGSGLKQVKFLGLFPCSAWEQAAVEVSQIRLVPMLQRGNGERLEAGQICQI